MADLLAPAAPLDPAAPEPEEESLGEVTEVKDDGTVVGEEELEFHQTQPIMERSYDAGDTNTKEKFAAARSEAGLSIQDDEVIGFLLFLITSETIGAGATEMPTVGIGLQGSVPVQYWPAIFEVFDRIELYHDEHGAG